MALEPPVVMTVTGAVAADTLGVALTHEHVVVDFVGAAGASSARLDADMMFRTALPALQRLRARGVSTFFDCTPAHVGRSPALLQRLSRASGLRIVTNTGYYGAAATRYLPPSALVANVDALAAHWHREWMVGIDGTGVRPGFIKLGVGSGLLSPMNERLVRAAARVHLLSGLTIAIHTGDGNSARNQVRVLESEGVGPTAMVWVHAQNDDGRIRRELAARGVWISLDGYSSRGENPARYLRAVLELHRHGHLPQVLVSHDDGWALEGPPPCRAVPFDNGNAAPYETLFTALWPALVRAGLDDGAWRQLMIDNPARAFSLSVRRV